MVVVEVRGWETYLRPHHHLEAKLEAEIQVSGLGGGVPLLFL